MAGGGAVLLPLRCVDGGTPICFDTTAKLLRRSISFVEALSVFPLLPVPETSHGTSYLNRRFCWSHPCVNHRTVQAVLLLSCGRPEGCGGGG